MKSVLSEGGPLIILNEADLPSWSGFAGKSFIGAAHPCESDYLATGFQSDGSSFLPSYTSVLEGVESSGLLIALPHDTALISSRPGIICIAQAVYADPDWSFSAVRQEPFDSLVRTRPNLVRFRANPGLFRMFDAACPAEQIDDGFIDFAIDGVSQLVYSDMYQYDANTLLVIHCIEAE